MKYKILSRKFLFKKSSIGLLFALVLIMVTIGFVHIFPRLKSLVISKADLINPNLTSAEIERISNSVVALECYKPVSSTVEQIYGSGTLINSEDIHFKTTDTPYNSSVILTNAHVVGSSSGNCFAVTKDRHRIGWWSFITSEKDYIIDQKNDFAVLYEPTPGKWLCDSSVKHPDDPKDLSNRVCTAPNPRVDQISNLTNSTLNMNSCTITNNSLVGQKIWVFGYPGLAFEIDSDGRSVYKQDQITTTGIISGVDSSGNFFTDAKIDNGSSGGLAVAKINNKPCIVGVPTWATIGNASSLGLIQPINKLNTLLIQ